MTIPLADALAIHRRLADQAKVDTAPYDLRAAEFLAAGGQVEYNEITDDRRYVIIHEVRVVPIAPMTPADRSGEPAQPNDSVTLEKAIAILRQLADDQYVNSDGFICRYTSPHPTVKAIQDFLLSAGEIEYYDDPDYDMPLLRLKPRA